MEERKILRWRKNSLSLKKVRTPFSQRKEIVISRRTKPTTKISSSRFFNEIMRSSPTELSAKAESKGGRDQSLLINETFDSQQTANDWWTAGSRGRAACKLLPYLLHVHPSLPVFLSKSWQWIKYRRAFSWDAFAENFTCRRIRCNRQQKAVVKPAVYAGQPLALYALPWFHARM